MAEPRWAIGLGGVEKGCGKGAWISGEGGSGVWRGENLTPFTPVGLPLLVEADLQGLGLSEGLCDGDALGLGLVQGVEQLLVLEQIA